MYPYWRPCDAAVLPVIAADAVANMLENCVPPVMRATGSEKLSWLDENRKTVQAMEDMAIPNSAGLTVSKVCHGEQPDAGYCTLRVFGKSWHDLQINCCVQPSVHSATMTSVFHVWIGHAIMMCCCMQRMMLYILPARYLSQ